MSDNGLIHGSPSLGMSFWALWGVAILTFLTKDLPGRAWSWLKRFVILSLEIPCSEDDFYRVVNWLEKRGHASRTHCLRITHGRVTPGHGTHFFFHEGQSYWITRAKDDSKSTTFSRRPREELTIRCLSRDQESIRQLLQTIRESDNSDRTIVNCWREGSWARLLEQPQRPMETIFLPRATKDALLDSLETFFKSHEWYLRHGIPYRMGICLHGPPGTGKTSIARAICAEFGLRLYAMALSAVDDSSLQTALSEVEPRSLVLIEDIDCHQEARAQEAKERKESEEKEKLGTLTLSGLLNGIDGAASSDALIFVFTTNHLNRIDPALLRPGRADLSLAIGPHTTETIGQAFERFFPGFVIPATFELAADLSPARLQGLIMSNRERPLSILQAIGRRSLEQIGPDCG